MNALFDNKTVFIIVKNVRADDSIYKLEVDAKTQKIINEIFDVPSEEILSKQRVEFTAGYTPLEDETFVIKNFGLSDQLKNAFCNPVSVPSFVMNREENPVIRAVCVGYCEDTEQGKCFKAAFQRFRKDQYISVSRLCLLFDDNTFRQDNRVGFTISEFVDSVFVGNDLLFSSYHFTRQIFDLSGYYRIATNTDIDTFVKEKVFDFGNHLENFKDGANVWHRRKISAINDSGILTKYKASELKKIAERQAGIRIKVKNNKIVFPTEPEETKAILSFLDEEAWKGPFSGETFLSNSKRKMKRKN